jgi:AraC-like DNA-binding protein
MTRQQWLLTKRLAKAKALLKNITQIRCDLGFNHTCQFSHTFKNAFDISPKAYQKN